MVDARIDIPLALIADFCIRWKIGEFSLFGSVLREDFRSDSDVDVLVSFLPEAKWDLYDLVYMQDELEAVFHRPVHLVDREGLVNPFRRKAILSTCQIIYAA